MAKTPKQGTEPDKLQAFTLDESLLALEALRDAYIAMVHDMKADGGLALNQVLYVYRLERRADQIDNILSLVKRDMEIILPPRERVTEH